MNIPIIISEIILGIFLVIVLRRTAFGKRLLRRFRKGRLVRFTWKSRLTRFAFFGLLLFYLVASFGPALAPYDPLSTDLQQSFASPSLEHLFGTDRLGRDVFTRVLYAMRTTAIISFVVFCVGGWFFTVVLGLLAGYRGGRTDAFILRTGEVLGSIPPLIFLIIVMVAFRDSFDAVTIKITKFLGMPWLVESGITNIILIAFALSLVAWVGGVYVLRSRALQEREQGYVESLRVLGFSEKRILFGHILPNVMGLIILSLSAILLSAVSAEVSLSFLGLGIQDPYPSFGIMVYQSASLGFLRNHFLLLAIPTFFVFYIGVLTWILGDQWGRITESQKSYV